MSNIPEITVHSPELESHPHNGSAGSHVATDPWPEQNRRRIELIHKKWQGGGLDADEQAELVRLQAVVRTLVAAALPPPLLTPAERAYVDSKAGH